MAMALIIIGAAIFFILGSLHLIYSFFDLKDPKRFAPADPSVLSAMQETTIRMRKDAKNLWLSSLGFHFSHSIGVLFYACVVIYVAAIYPAMLLDPVVAAVMIGVGAAYVLLAHFFWFIIPFVGSLLGTALIAAGIVMKSFSL